MDGASFLRKVGFEELNDLGEKLGESFPEKIEKVVRKTAGRFCASFATRLRRFAYRPSDVRLYARYVASTLEYEGNDALADTRARRSGGVSGAISSITTSSLGHTREVPEFFQRGFKREEPPDELKMWAAIPDGLARERWEDLKRNGFRAEACAPIWGVSRQRAIFYFQWLKKKLRSKLNFEEAAGRTE